MGVVLVLRPLSSVSLAPEQRLNLKRTFSHPPILVPVWLLVHGFAIRSSPMSCSSCISDRV